MIAACARPGAFFGVVVVVLGVMAVIECVSWARVLVPRPTALAAWPLKLQLYST